MVKVEAIIKLFKCATLTGEYVPSGFRITLKVGELCYYAQLFSIDGNNIPLGEKRKIFIDIVYGELDIEKFLSHSRFEFVSWEKLGEGCVIEVIDICIEQDALNEVDKERQNEILSIISDYRKDSSKY